MSEYAFAPDPEMCFDTARAGLEEMIAAARNHGAAGDWTADAAESAVIDDGRAVALAVLQGFFDTRAAAEAKARAEADLDAPVDADGVRHTRCEPGHVRLLACMLGRLQVHRLAFRAPGAENLYPADAELNPVGRPRCRRGIIHPGFCKWVWTNGGAVQNLLLSIARSLLGC